MSYFKIFSIFLALILTLVTAEARKKIDPEAQRAAKDLRNKFICLRALNDTARELGMSYADQKIQVAKTATSSCSFCGNGSEDVIFSNPLIWKRGDKDVYVTLTDISGPNLKKKAPVISLLEYDRVESGSVCLVDKKQRQLTRVFKVLPGGEVSFDDNNFSIVRCSGKNPVKSFSYVQPREVREEEASLRQASLFSDLDAEIERMINYASYDRIKSTVEKRSKWRERGQSSKSPFYVARDKFAPPECDEAITRIDLKNRLEQAREDVVNLSKWSRSIESVSEDYITEKNNAAISGKKKGSVARRENPPAPAPAALEGSYTAPAALPPGSSSSQGTN